MKTPRLLLAALAAASLTLAAVAGDPTGTWKWTTEGRNGQSFESTLKLELKDGQLAGTMLGRQGGQFTIPDVAIGDASFKDDAVAFTITREFNGNKMVVKYSGKLEGDIIKGTTERTNRDGQAVKRDWTATRAK